MSGIETRLGIRAAQWLLDAVMMRRLPLWQRCVLAVLLVLLFIVPPVAVIAVLAVIGIAEGQPVMLLVSALLAVLTVWFWASALRKYAKRRRR